ncbi:DUF6233 domain-containing protein [Streptomyces sp. NPDC002676]
MCEFVEFPRRREGPEWSSGRERQRANRDPPEWIVELGIGVGRPPVQIHRGTCYMAGTRRRPVERDEARRLLADGTSACSHCRPDTGLGIIDSTTLGLGQHMPAGAVATRV